MKTKTSEQTGRRKPYFHFPLSIFHFQLIAALFFAAPASAQTVGVCSSIANAVKIEEAGGAYLEGNVQKFLVPDRDDAEFEKNLASLKDSPIPMYAFNGFLPKEIVVTGENANPEAAIAWAAVAIPRAKKSGAKYIVFGSAESRRLRDGFPKEKADEQFVALLKEMGKIAAENGITVVVEPLQYNECNYINKVSEGLEIVEKTGHPNIMCLADIYHMLAVGEDAGVLVDGVRSGKIVHVHVAELQDRAAPGTHNDPNILPYYRALKEAGYKGGISIECRWKDFDTQIAPAIANVTSNF